MNTLFAFATQVTSENSKRVLYTLFLILIIALALLSFIGWIIITVTKYQGELVDREISDPLRQRVIKTEEHFMKYAIKKNNLLFFEQSSLPLLIVLIGVAVLMLFYIIGDNWGYNPWNMDTGFGSLLFTWDFSTIITINPSMGAGILINWPQVTHSPTFDINNWCGYVCCSCYLVGGLWYLYTVQGLIGRTLRILHLKRKMFDKSLEDFKVADNLANFNVNK